MNAEEKLLKIKELYLKAFEYSSLLVDAMDKTNNLINCMNNSQNVIEEDIQEMVSACNDTIAVLETQQDIEREIITILNFDDGTVDAVLKGYEYQIETLKKETEVYKNML